MLFLYNLLFTLYFCCFFFFFQAEDGIRDGTVTGVQTCALPICRFLLLSEDRVSPALAPAPNRTGTHVLLYARDLIEEEGARSEERRVGKECRSRWSPYH